MEEKEKLNNLMKKIEIKNNVFYYYVEEIFNDKKCFSLEQKIKIINGINEEFEILIKKIKEVIERKNKK